MKHIKHINEYNDVKLYKVVKPHEMINHLETSISINDKYLDIIKSATGLNPIIRMPIISDIRIGNKERIEIYKKNEYCISIYQLDDEYFALTLSLTLVSENYYYLCDTIQGVIQLLKNLDLNKYL